MDNKCSGRGNTEEGYLTKTGVVGKSFLEKVTVERGCGKVSVSGRNDSICREIKVRECIAEVLKNHCILRVWRERAEWRGIRLHGHKVSTHINIHSTSI